MMNSSSFGPIVEPRGVGKVRRAGRYGDTELVHVSPRERQVMRRLFGPETRNPKTGLPEHFLGELLGLGGMLGGGISEALGFGLGEAAQSALGNALIGGATGALAGGDLQSTLLGAGAGGLGGYFLPDTMNYLGDTDIGKYLGLGKEALGTLSSEPSEGLVNMAAKKAADYEGVTEPLLKAATSATAPKKEESFFQKYKNPLLAGGGALLLLSMLNQKKSGQQGPPAGFAPVSTTRAPINVSLPQRQYQGAGANPSTYGYGGEQSYYKYASGGRASGPGGPRDDLVPAMLSDGEHVIDTETVSLMGDGSNDRGHQQIERLKATVRKKKGDALRRGRIAPPAGALQSFMRRR